MFSIKFLGCGNASTTQDYYQSNMLITSKPSNKKLLIDCGTDARFSLGEAELNAKDIDAIYISHCHADHIGGLEWLGLTTYFDPSVEKKPEMFLVDNLVPILWRSLQSGMQSHEGKVLTLKSFFNVNPIHINSSFYWEDIKFTPFQTVHIMNGMEIIPSYGLLIEDRETILVTTDTKVLPQPFYDKADVIFHDCETAPYRSGVHAHYEELQQLPTPTRNKMWLYHYQPNPKQIPKDDGFQGFVRKGETFEF